MSFIKLNVEIDSVIIGERVKGGIYRPCLETIPSSTIRGAFKNCLGLEINGVGIFVKDTYQIKDFVYSVKDKFLETAKMPFVAEYLSPKGNSKIKAEIYIVKNNGISPELFENVEFYIGALKSKGFGKTKVIEIEEISSDIKQGFLNVRIYEDECDKFNITVLSPIYGYLFYPTDIVSGIYKMALLENSLVKAPEIFLKEETFYDE
ncbi:MAG: hypothetical protein HXY52_09570 [Nitrospirae bacterium]|jgi:hypothetical protein|nr:hypothetical protein [Nitrospirota bacterium]